MLFRSNSWTGTGSLITGRYGHTATLLPGGKVLVAGGSGLQQSFLASAELYDPTTGSWTNTGPLNIGRYNHTSTLLPDGQILVAGGIGYAGDVAMAELYDPTTGKWTLSGALATARDAHSATLRTDGKVLVAGGSDNNGNRLATTELFDPATRTWIPGGSLKAPRNEHKAILLPDGQVLIAGGSILTNHVVVPISNAELSFAGLGFISSWQPQITWIVSPLVLGGSLVITGAQFRGVAEGSGCNTQDSSTDYPLVELGSLGGGQTIFLPVTNCGASFFISGPVWNFPPGYALATVFVNGVPSTSSIVNISVPIAAPTTLAGIKTTNGEFQLNFTNSVGALFGVLAATNLAQPLTSWTALGGGVEISPGQFQYTDTQATNYPQRFYQIFSP